MAKLKKTQFKFRKHESIGAPAAEDDEEFLDECFVDTGDLEILKDPTENPRIVVGRTGAGKTALLLRLRETEDHAVWIAPESLSLQYLSNSTILPELERMGVRLEIFYKLLWKHVFTIELLKAKFPIRTEDEKKTWMGRVFERFFGEKKKEDAFRYLEEWGDSFWKDTDFRIKEVTQRFEDDVRARIGAEAKALGTGASADASIASKKTLEARAEVVQRAQDVVSKIQLQQLSRVIDTLAEDYFHQPQPRYYVVIDRLDENWADDSLRYKLIKALLEAIKEFKRIPSAKVVIALRRDLLDRVIRETREAGFQEEKYRPFILPLSWTRDQLLSLLDRRVKKLVRRQYTTNPVGWKDLMPRRVGNESTADYVLDRTMRRPRDVIDFFNCCMREASPRPDITVHDLRAAEKEYSRNRIRALADEWYADYPELLPLTEVLKKTPTSFRLGDFEVEKVERIGLELVASEQAATGELSDLVGDYVQGGLAPDELCRRLFVVFYRTGLVGLKTETYNEVNWAFGTSGHLSEAEIDQDTRVAICPMFYRVLGTDLGRKAK